MTNDGDLAYQLTDPDHEIPKIYIVKVYRTPTPEQIKELSNGFRLDGRKLKPCRIELLDKALNPGFALLSRKARISKFEECLRPWVIR